MHARVGPHTCILARVEPYTCILARGEPYTCIIGVKHIHVPGRGASPIRAHLQWHRLSTCIRTLSSQRSRPGRVVSAKKHRYQRGLAGVRSGGEHMRNEVPCPTCVVAAVSPERHVCAPLKMISQSCPPLSSISHRFVINIYWCILPIHKRTCPG